MIRMNEIWREWERRTGNKEENEETKMEEKFRDLILEISTRKLKNNFDSSYIESWCVLNSDERVILKILMSRKAQNTRFQGID